MSCAEQTWLVSRKEQKIQAEAVPAVGALKNALGML